MVIRYPQGGLFMKTKVVLACALTLGMASPALADYYIVQSSKTHKCSVQKNKPSEKSKTVTLVGDGTAYKTKAEATAAMGTLDACKSPT
jgi:hypothetical protein